jgi:hypothetical protein
MEHESTNHGPQPTLDNGGENVVAGKVGIGRYTRELYDDSKARAGSRSGPVNTKIASASTLGPGNLPGAHGKSFDLGGVHPIIKFLRRLPTRCRQTW